jgi:hypothetical protein
MITIPAYDTTKANCISMIDRLLQIKEVCLEISDEQFISMDFTDKRNTIRFFDNMASEQFGGSSREAREKAKPYISKSTHLISLLSA